MGDDNISMNRLISSGVKIVLIAILATGWKWTTLLKDQGIINDNLQIRFLIGITLLIILEQVYSELPKPVNKSLVETRRLIIEDYLQSFLAKYYKYLRSLKKYKNKPVPVIRVNIMLPTRILKIFSYLRIYFYYCPDGITYTEDEKTLKWYSNHGTCGWAWKYCASSLFDSIHPDLKLPAGRLNKKQKAICASIKSTLSIPIVYEGKVVGVLNLDSKENISDTLFSREKVYNTARACADALRAEFYNDGIAV